MTDNEKMGCGSFLLVATIFAAFFIFSMFVKRVDPGHAGVLVDYGAGTATGEPQVKSLNTGQYVIVNPALQNLVQQPISQQTLNMIQLPNADDSVACRDRTGIPINVDVSVIWRIDPSKVGDLHLIRPNMTLENNTDNDIGSQVVRPLARNAVADTCGTFAYGDIFNKREEFGQVASKDLTSSLTKTYLILDQIQIRDFKLGPEQQKALNEKAVAEQQAEAARFLEARRMAEARAAIEQARGEAEAIRLIQLQIANSPEYVNYLATTKWDGKLPQVTSGAVPFIQLPTRGQ